MGRTEPILYSILLFGGTYGVARLSALVCRRLLATDSVRPKLLRYYYVCLQLLAAVGVATINLRYMPGAMALEAVTSGTISGTVMIVANGITWGLLTAFGLFVGVRGFGSVLTDIYPWLDTVDRRLRRCQQVGLVIVSVGMAAILEATWTDPTPIGPEWLIPALLLLFVSYLAIVWQIAVPGYTVRRAEPDERERVERWYDEIDALEEPPSSVIVFDEETRPASVIAGGWRSTRWVWVHERVLSELEDEALGIALTQAEAKRRAHFWPLLVVRTFVGFGSLVLAALGLLAMLLVGPVPRSFYLVLAASAVVIGGATWALRRASYRADDGAAAAFGADRVAEAYLRLEDLNFMPTPTETPILESLIPEPSTEGRIERLCNRYSVDPPLDFESSSVRDWLDERIPPLTWPLLIGACTVVLALGTILLLVRPQWNLSDEAALVIAAALAFAWFGFPIGIYVDAIRARSVGEWPSYPKLLALLSIVWGLNVLVGSWYLWKRRRVSSDRSTATAAGS